MADRNALLRLLYEAHRRTSSLYLEVHDRERREASNVLVVQPGVGNGMRARWMSGGPNAAPLVRTRRIWFEPPTRVRVEMFQLGNLVAAAARDGDAWWRWTRESGESVGDVADGAALPPLLDIVHLHPARLLATSWLEVTGTGNRASREVLTVRATQRWTGSTDASTLTTDFDFDIEHGTPLYVAIHEADETISVSEAVNVEYSQGIDPTTFRFELRDETDMEAGRPASRPTGPSAINGQTRSHETRVSPITAHRTIWLSGLPGAGKTTIARAVERLLHQLGAHCCVLDGDELRKGLSSDLGLSREDRGEQARRVAHIASTLADSGVIPVVALVSPYAADRDRARQIHEAKGVGFLEVWVATPLEVCIGRDPKGLYTANAASAAPGSGAADGSGLTGIGAPYEPPVSPDLVVSGDKQPPRVAAAQIIEQLVATAGATRLVALP